MIAYREIVNDKKDLDRVFEILKNIKQKSEIIILPLNEKSDKKTFIDAQNTSLKTTWDNEEDKAWDAL